MVMTGPMAFSARAALDMPASSGGTPMEPVAMITPWPGIRRGTLMAVPKPPGLVSVQVVPAKSALVSLPTRPRSTRSWKAP